MKGRGFKDSLTFAAARLPKTIVTKVNLTAGLDDSKSGSSCHVAANWRATTARGFPPASYIVAQQ